VSNTRAVTAFVALVVAAALTAPASAAYPDTGATCEGVQGPTALVVFPDGTKLNEQTHRVYSGTEFRLFLCQGDGDRVPMSAWSLSTPDGFSATEVDGGDYYLMEVNGALDDVRLAVPDRISAPDNMDRPSGPTIAVATGNVVTRRPPLDSMRSAETVYFESTERARNYRRAVGAYHDSVEEIYAAAETVNTTDGSAVSSDTIYRLGNHSPGQTGYDEVEEALAPAAMSGKPGAASALETYHSVQRETEKMAERTLIERREALQRQARDDAWTVLGNLLGTLAGGLVLGLAVGWYVTKQRVDEVTYHRRRTSTVDFDPSLMRTPLVAAAVLGVLAVALIIATGHLQPLIRVIVTVMP
jgi:hypothetical protein